MDSFLLFEQGGEEARLFVFSRDNMLDVGIPLDHIACHGLHLVDGGFVAFVVADDEEETTEPQEEFVELTIKVKKSDVKRVKEFVNDCIEFE